MKTILASLACIALIAGSAWATTAPKTDQLVASGQVLSINAKSNELKLETKPDQEMTFRVSEKTKILRDGVAVDLATIKTGEQATVNYEKGASVPLAISVELKGSAT